MIFGTALQLTTCPRTARRFTLLDGRTGRPVVLEGRTFVSFYDVRTPRPDTRRLAAAHVRLAPRALPIASRRVRSSTSRSPATSASA